MQIGVQVIHGVLMPLTSYQYHMVLLLVHTLMKIKWHSYVLNTIIPLMGALDLFGMQKMNNIAALTTTIR